MMTSFAPDGFTPSCSGLGYPGVSKSNRLLQLTLAELCYEVLGLFPTRQQTAGAHFVEGGRCGIAVGQHQLVPARPVDRQRRVGRGNRALALRVVFRRA